MGEVYLNGAFVPAEHGRVSAMDRGFLFGDGVYEIIPSYGGHLLRLDDHLDRLEDGLSLIRLDDPLRREEWQVVLARLIGPPPVPDQYLYLQVTRGAAPDLDLLCPAAVAPTVFAAVRPLPPRPAEWATVGVAAITRPDIRWHRSEIKTISLQSAVMMRREAEDEGALEAILVRDGMLTQGAASNVFVVLGGNLITPPRSHLVLPGITRELVIELARGLGLHVLERRVPLEELTGADEIWLTSSLREVLPVTRLDAAPVGAGVPGPLWRRLDTLWQGYKTRVRQGHDH
jgi:D-alanine transaminase